ncbi:host cell division inhibitor Icd-like protein [Klebsiella pneumoniae]|nr:host cell division inhibitor Icd-like protein [Klebsiella pneumoniae]MEC5561049.1 host cell division inhibitor Icd-like protein [Klebsiella pneumoniae]
MPTIKPKIYHIAAPSEREARSYLGKVRTSS